MKLVLDNNILFSLMNPYSTNSYLFSLLKTEFMAPEFIKEEFEKYKSECLIKSKLSEQEFEIRQREIEEQIEFFKLSEYKDFLKQAKDAIADPDDIDFLALALSIDTSIWSNDPHLKQQSLVKVFTTQELIEKLLKDKI